MAGVGVNRFLEALSQNQLLEAEQGEELADLQFRFPDSRELAQELIRRVWLTPYQVNLLFLGRGQQLNLGKYILLERLGEGGMGQVFKARQRSLQRLVAIKILRKECLENPRAIPRFEREIQLAAQLSHPNIVHAFDAGRVAQSYYFAMEYVDGIGLDRLVKQSGPLRVEQACDYLRQAALGLQHAHQRGMVHRDIKPANHLLVSPPGESRSQSRSGFLRRPGSGPAPWGTIKILDLGLARWLHHESQVEKLTQLGALMGTPDFIAPEQALNCRTSDSRADLYSLGCTFYFLLAGRPPFPQGSINDKLLQHRLDEPEPVEQVRRENLLKGLSAPEQRQARKLVEIPFELAELVRCLMAKRPEDRCQTAAELAAALSAWLNTKSG